MKTPKSETNSQRKENTLGQLMKENEMNSTAR